MRGATVAGAALCGLAALTLLVLLSIGAGGVPIRLALVGATGVGGVTSIAAGGLGLRRSRRGAARERRSVEAHRKEADAEDRSRIAKLERRLEQNRDQLRSARGRLHQLMADREEAARLEIAHDWPTDATGRHIRPHEVAGAVRLCRVLIEAGRAPWAGELLTDQRVRGRLTTWTLLRAFDQLRGLGFLITARAIAAELAERSGDAADADRVSRCDEQITMVTWRPAGDVPSSAAPAARRSGPVLHVVAKAMPDVQAGYTLRTHHLASAQARLGMGVAVAVQAGGEDRDVVDREHVVLDGVDIHRLPGPRRGSVPWPEWMEINIAGLVDLIGTIGPSVLHAHSDFVQALITGEASRRTGVPWVYEVRGFWEETGLASLAAKFPLVDHDQLRGSVGLPDTYLMRADQERFARAGADRVITLARLMADHIERSDGDRQRPRPEILANAVDVERFTPSDPRVVRTRLGLAEDVHVFGYVTTMWSYEGVDVLLRAFHQLNRSTGGRRPALLLVGDGKALPGLRELAEELGDADVIMTGQVPFADIPGYYDAIDTFVVPRRPERVTELVTPLKPFEALAMEKRVIMSDVGALREIAEDFDGIRLFPAGDVSALAAVLQTELSVDRTQLRDPRARRWVSEHRTWRGLAERTREIYRDVGAVAWTESAELESSPDGTPSRNGSGR